MEESTLQRPPICRIKNNTGGEQSSRPYKKMKLHVQSSCYTHCPRGDRLARGDEWSAMATLTLSSGCADLVGSVKCGCISMRPHFTHQSSTLSVASKLMILISSPQSCMNPSSLIESLFSFARQNEIIWSRRCCMGPSGRASIS